MTKKYMAHSVYIKSGIATLMVAVTFVGIPSIIYFSGAFGNVDINTYIKALIIASVILLVDIVICLFRSLFFISFSPEKIYTYNYKLLGIPKRKEYDLKDISRVEIDYCIFISFSKFRGLIHSKSITFYVGYKAVIIADITDNLLEVVLQHIPANKIKIYFSRPGLVAKKQRKLLYPLLNKKQQKEFANKGYKWEDE